MSDRRGQPPALREQQRFPAAQKPVGDKKILILKILQILIQTRTDIEICPYSSVDFPFIFHHYVRFLNGFLGYLGFRGLARRRLQFHAVHRRRG